MGMTQNSFVGLLFLSPKKLGLVDLSGVEDYVRH